MLCLSFGFGFGHIPLDWSTRKCAELSLLQISDRKSGNSGKSKTGRTRSGFHLEIGGTLQNAQLQ
jgi:hypothetical protein